MELFLGIIPARYASTRFPGKPLADIGGKSMIMRVYERVSPVLDDLYVATDDRRIADAVSSAGGKVVMTSASHATGTDRCAEALVKIRETEKKKFTVLVNIQGDEPFIDPEQVRQLMHCFRDPDTRLATLVRKAEEGDDLFNPNLVKVAVSPRGEALYFSRSVIPHFRNLPEEEWITRGTHFLHVGLYAYRTHTLEEITRLVPTPLETGESLEQLRWLEHGYRITTALTSCRTMAVDTPEDLEKILKSGIV